MPTETGRVVKRKRVNLPSGGTVDIPVITQITFLDVVEQGQEYEFHIENSAAANRDVHVATIPGGGAATNESGSGSDSDLKVERIDVWRVLDIVSRAQESFIHLDNKTIQEPPGAPPYFTTHEKTHIVKYINTPDDGNWIKSELIDRFKILDVVEQGQEREYFLFNPPDNTGISGLTLGTDSDGKTTVAVDSGLPDISDSGNGVDPAWRTDPFQNIVDWSAEPWLFFGLQFASGDSGSIQVAGGNSHQALGAKLTSQEYLTGFFTTRLPSSGSGTFISTGKTYNFTGLGSFSGPGGSLDPFTVCGWAGINPGPFDAERIRTLVTASGAPYLQYPTAANPDPGWLASTSVTVATLAWDGTGPFDIYATDPINGPFIPGLLSDATASQVSADYSGTPGSAPNLSIYEFGDSQGTASQDFSGLVVTGPVGSSSPGTWLPVAVFVGQIGPLRDGFVKQNASQGTATILLKRQ